MAKIILAPWSAKLPTGRTNPKNPPMEFWIRVVNKLNALSHEVIQLGVAGEERIEGVSQFIQNWPFKKLRDVVSDCDLFLSVDTWLPHFVFAEKLNKRGVVVFSLSSPEIWGHAENINLLKDRKYLRPRQFQTWFEVEYNEDAFVAPDTVVEAVLRCLNHKTEFIPVPLKPALR